MGRVSAASHGIPDRDEWDRHWDEYAHSAEHNPAQRFRRTLILSLLGKAPEHLLDIGSGQGDFAADATAAFPQAQILGLELSASGVQVSHRKVPTAEFLQCDLLSDQQPPHQRVHWATHAVCAEVLEHLDEPERLLSNIRPWLAPGCRLVVTVPGGPMSQFDRHIGHRRHFSPSDLRALLEHAGFRVEQAHGAGFPFFNLYRCVVIARGRKLVNDVAQQPSPAARLAMESFGVLFRGNLRRHGWQTVAVAVAP